MTDEGIGRFAREDVLPVLASFGITSAERATGTGVDEEIILLRHDDFARIDVRAVTVALMGVLPHVKVWVIERHPAWSTEPV